MAEVDPQTAQKTGVAKQKKDAGDQAFKAGETTTGALALLVISSSVSLTCCGLHISSASIPRGEL